MRPSQRTLPWLLLFAAGTLLTTGCQPQADTSSDVVRPTLDTMADTVAMRVYDAMGGPEAWAAFPYLQYDFAVQREAGRYLVARHLWDRQSGNYRLELPRGSDSVHVVLFDIDTREGSAYLNGAPLDSARTDQLVQEGYRRFINDMYWLLAPVKTFDPGVTRTYVADSSTAEVDVVKLTFGDVGLTPDDQYWLYVDKESNLVQEWAFVLQGNPDAPPNHFRWTNYAEYSTPEGPIQLASQKESVAGPGVIYTDNIETPTEVPDDLFTDPNPRLLR